MQVIDAQCTGDLFVVRVRLPDGTTLRLNADTGGGGTVAADRVECLPRVPIPGITDTDGVRLPLDPALPSGHDVAAFGEALGPFDGVMSAWWLVDRVWAFDYGRGQLELLEQSLTEGTRLGFVAAGGALRTPFPRIRVTIDGEPVDLLLDTGATVELTAAGAAAWSGPRTRAISFITDSVFRRWRHRHPEWPVVEAASELLNSPMILVPEVVVGDVPVGPVWFEHRADQNFHDYMSQWMDCRVDGALGGNAFAGSRLIVDYSTQRAKVT